MRSFWYSVIRSIFNVITYIWLGMKVFGRENIPNKGAFIVASNHASYFDPPFQAFPASSLEKAGGFTEKDGEDLPVPSLRSSCARGGEFRQIPLGIWLSEGRSSLGRRINLLHLLSE
mgnify:CR=1 FL=1